MGGNLAWTLRCEDGTEYRMDHWTNAMPGMILNPGFLAGETGAIDAALADWLAMKADWEENRESESYTHKVTPFYAPYPYGTRPSEYGLVVTDFVTKTILSLQSYTDLGKIHAIRLDFGADARESFPGKVEQLEEVVQQGRIASWEFLLRNRRGVDALCALGGTVTKERSDTEACLMHVPGTVDFDNLCLICDTLRDDVPENPLADKLAAVRAQADGLDPKDPEREKLEAVLDAAHSSHRYTHNPFISIFGVMDLAPFTLEEFDESADGYAALLARILALGFDLSLEERAAWEMRIAEFR